MGGIERPAIEVQLYRGIKEDLSDQTPLLDPVMLDGMIDDKVLDNHKNLNRGSISSKMFQLLIEKVTFIFILLKRSMFLTMFKMKKNL